MSAAIGLSRREAMRLGAAASALPLVHVRTAGAAGKLAVAFWDHWVPGGNDPLQKQVTAWGMANKVEVTADFLSGNNKLLLTGVAEAQAGTGHDIMTFANWDGFNVAEALAPVDDLMGRLTAKYGPVDKTAEYLARAKGPWLMVPTSTGTQTLPACARISMMKKYGFDVQEMYPTRPEYTDAAKGWTYEAFLAAATAAQKDGYPFALGIGGSTNTDGTNMVGASFQAFGARLMDEHGTILLNSDAVMRCLEYWQTLLKVLPAEIASYDNASNNRALISGKSALIFNPPSAWAVAKRDAPQIAADCWTFSAPSGPAGRFVPTLSFFWGIFRFSRSQTAAKELIEHLLQREQIEERANAVYGYDLPPFPSMNDFKIWEEVGPPRGTVYNYPIRPWHRAKPSLTGSEAKPELAVQIYQHAIHDGILARMKQGQSIQQAVAWAQDELEGFKS